MNASNLKYRNRLKRRVMITRKQLYQPAPLHDPPSSTDHHPVVVPRQQRLVGDNGMKSIHNNNLEGQSKEDRDGFVSRRGGNGDGSSNNNYNTAVANRSDGRLSNNNHSDGSKLKAESNNFTRSNDSEEKMQQRANEMMISKQSQRNNNNNSSVASSSPPRANKGNNENHDNFDNDQATPTRKNSAQNRSNGVSSMINRYERRGGGGGGGGPISSNSNQTISSKEQPRWTQSQSQQMSYPKQRQLYSNNTKNAAAQHQYTTTTMSPPERQDEMSMTTSILTDEAMEDRNSMIRNVIQWEKRMHLKRQQQDLNHQQQWQQLGQGQQQQQPNKDNTKQSSSENEGNNNNNNVNLVNEAIAINVNMTKNNMKRSPIRTFQSSLAAKKKSSPPIQTFQSLAASTTKKSDLNNRLGNNIMSTTTTMSTTPKNYKSAVKAAVVVTPNDDDDRVGKRMNENDTNTGTNHNPPLPPPPSSSSPDDENKDLPPSPASTDHSADAAAGMMMFASNKKKSSSSSARKKVVGSGVVKNEEQDCNEEMKRNRNEESWPSGGGDTNPTTRVGSGSSTPSSRIVSPSSKEDNTPPSSSPTKITATNPTSTPHHHHRHHQLNLEQKLVRLASTTTTNHNHHHHPTTNTSPSKVSVISVQPSIESECVRQNAEILLAMEDAMMDFMGNSGADGEVGVGGAGRSDGGVGTVQAVDDNGENDVDEDEGDVNNEERLNEAYVENIGPRAATLVSPDSQNNQWGNTSSTLFSLEERDESDDDDDDYADPPLHSSDSNTDSNSRRSDDASSRSGFISDEHSDGGGEFVIAKRKKNKDLGTFFDQLGSLFGVKCALDRDEDSDIFYMNNSQFNTSLFSGAEFEEMHQRRIIDGGAGGGDATRKVVPPTTIHSAESFCGESHTTMPSGNTAKQRDQLVYLSPPRQESGPVFEFARHDIGGDDPPPDPDLSLEIDDDDDDDVDAEGDNSSLPDPEEGSGADDDKSGRDPPRGIDPEEGGEAVHHRNASAALNLDHVKTSTREKNKSSSLHWQTSNGLILDDETNAKQLSSIRAAKASEESESTSTTIPPSISANTTILQEHFVEKSEHKLSPNYRRRGGGQLQFIDEVEDEDDDPSVGEENEGPQYEYEQFMEDFRDVVQKDPIPCEPESVEELVIGSISESSSLKDEEVDLHPKSKLQNVKQRREMEAAMQRSMRQASHNRQRKYLFQDPKPGLVTSQFEGQQQVPQTTQSSGQPINRNAVKQPLSQAAPSHQYKHVQPKAAKTRLEEKLQGLGAPTKLSGDSVGTSELGSLYSASFAAGVPKTVFQRPNLPPPTSSMQNASNQGARQRALNTMPRGLTPDFSAQGPLGKRDSPQLGHSAAKGDGDGFADGKNTLGFIPIGSETWKLKHEFFDSSPLDPPPGGAPLGFPSSNDEASQVSDGFGRLNNNTLGSLQVGKETWNLKYDFHDSPAAGNDKFNPPQPQKVDRRQDPEPVAPPTPEPVAPPTVNRYRQKIPLRPPQHFSNRHSPKKLVMKSETKNRDGTQVHTLRFVGREDSPSPQQPFSLPSRLSSGKKKLFQSFPSAVKVARPVSSPQSQRGSGLVKDSKQSNQPGQGQRNQGSQIDSRKTAKAKGPMPTRPMVNRSLEDKLRSVDPPSSERPTLTEAEASQISGSVFEAVEVGSFGVQHTLFSKWDKPKDNVNRHSAQPHPYQSQPPQRQAQASRMQNGRNAVYKSVSYVSTFNGRQDQVVAKLSNFGRFRRKK